MKKNQQKNRSRARVCQLALSSPRATVRLNADGAQVMIACPKCGETRLIERVDAHRWFCAVCAHAWTIGANDGGHEPSSEHVDPPPDRARLLERSSPGSIRPDHQRRTDRSPTPSHQRRLTPQLCDRVADEPTTRLNAGVPEVVRGAPGREILHKSAIEPTCTSEPPWMSWANDGTIEIIERFLWPFGNLAPNARWPQSHTASFSRREVRHEVCLEKLSPHPVRTGAAMDSTIRPASARRASGPQPRTDCANAAQARAG